MNLRSTTVLAFLPLAAAGMVLVSWSAPAQLGDEDDLRVTGHVTGWQLREDGTFYVRIHPSGGAFAEAVPAGGQEADDEEEAEEGDERGRAASGAVWFRSPGDQTESTQFEELLLQVVLHASASDAGQPPTLTIVGEREPDENGEDPSSALDIQTVSHP